MASRKFDLPDMESEIFFAKGLDKKFAKLPVGQITSGKTMQSWLLKPNRRYFRLRRQNLALGKLSKDSDPSMRGASRYKLREYCLQCV